MIAFVLLGLASAIDLATPPKEREAQAAQRERRRKSMRRSS